MDTHLQEIEQFIAVWPDSSSVCRDQFIQLKTHLLKLEGARIEFMARPGVTYSLRAGHADQRERPLFAMIDVIEDDPRWLSICFYSEMVRDPEERGDHVPGGLLGEDGLCFDVEAGDEELVSYVAARIDEAHSAVCSG